MEVEEKKVVIMNLIIEIDEPLLDFFDLESNKMLDEKIEVLKKLKEGKSISEIPNFYDILEKDMNYIWD